MAHRGVSALGIVPSATVATRRAVARSRSAWRFLVTCCVMAVMACGKKGPPLAPVVRVPAAVDKVDIRRVGNDIYLTVRVPTRNIDQSVPADVARIDVFAATTTATPPRGRFFDIATRIATIAVPPAPTRDTPAPAPPSVAGPAQGSLVTIRETLTADAFIPRTLPAAPSSRGDLPALPGRVIPTENVLRRFYYVLAYSPRDRVEPAAPIAELLLTPLPEPPADISASYSQTTITLSWPPSGGLVGFLMERATPPESAPFDDDPGAPSTRPPAVPLGTTTYNVYRTMAPDPRAATPAQATPVAPWNTPPPTPLNMMPLAQLSATDEVEFEREVCYQIRALRGVAPNAIEGEPSAPVCLTPVDTFPPAKPEELSAVAGEGVVSLIWSPSLEPDVAGYIVLRGAPGDATLQPISAAPLTASQFTDRSVTPGVRYTYAVSAIDNRVPVPNESPESDRVEVTAQ